MKLTKKNSRKKGFTLIELIVVVSIIIILSGFLVPKVIGYQDKAKKAKVVNTARQIFDTSMESYTEEEGVLTQSKIFASIKAVTDVVSDSAKVVVLGDDTTVTFDSDSKTYDVVVTAKNNKFLVNEVSGTGADRSVTEVYKNKD
ncbi:MAG: type II secretion system protein [Clostridiaceae bacterium]|nr:type II secretion system protein [Clostridiaceae bacterium]